MKKGKLKSHIFFRRRTAYRLLNSRKNVIFVNNRDDPGWWDEESFCKVITYDTDPRMADIEDIGKEWFNICKSCLRGYLIKRYKPNLFLKYKNTQLVLNRIRLLAERSIDFKYIY